MITITLQQINVSCQVRDIAYGSLQSGGQSGKNHPGSLVNTKPFILGVITNINRVTNEIEIDENAGGGVGMAGLPYNAVLTDLYVFFQKPQLINTSGVTGYFLETEYRNYSTLPAEMFATAVDYIESSK